VVLPDGMARAVKHLCHARGCQKAVKPELLMCPPHWRRVPKNIQARVWDTYREGQCDDKNPSKDWHEAADAAIGYIAKLEEQPVTAAEERALVAATLWV
jgi:hypothetical protein